MPEVIQFPSPENKLTFKDAAPFLSFAFSGLATFAIENTQSENILVFKISRYMHNKPTVFWGVTQITAQGPIHLGVVSSGDPPIFSADHRVSFTGGSKGVRVFQMLIGLLVKGAMPSTASVYPLGKCCICGRKTGHQVRIHCSKHKPA
jgi:hypothetical protein